MVTAESARSDAGLIAPHGGRLVDRVLHLEEKYEAAAGILWRSEAG